MNQEAGKKETGTESKVREEGFLLACSLAHAYLGFYTTQAYLPRKGATHSGLGPLISIRNQANAIKTLPQTKMIKVFPQLELPLPR